LEKVSRTKRKRLAEALQLQGEQLLELDEAKVQALDLPLELKEAVLAARRTRSHGARRRQLQYIGRLMRDYDSEAVRTALQKLEAQEDPQRRQFKRVAHWRDELLAGDENLLHWLVETFPRIDADQLHQLVDRARGSSGQSHARQAARQLFRLLSQLGEQP
jgi:ribosome-associated protein